MTARKIVRKDVIRLARQKLWTDIGKAIDSYEKHVYGDRALTSTRTESVFGVTRPELWQLGQHIDLLDKELQSRDICQECAHFHEEHHDGRCWRPLHDRSPCPCEGFVERQRRSEDKIESRVGDITTAAEIAAILPPEPTRSRSRGRKKPSPVSDHIRGVQEAMQASAREDGFEGALPQPEIKRDTVYSRGLGSSEETVLILIVQSAGGMTPAQIAIKVALKKRTIQNILTALKSLRYLIKDENHGKFRATEEGKAAVKGLFSDLKPGAILEELSESERKVLFAIASKKEGVTLSAISVMVPGITKRTKQNIITALKTRELIEKNEERFKLTEYARDELKGKLAKPLTGKALREQLRESLPAPQAVVFDWLCYDGGRAGTPGQIAEALDYAPRTVQNIITALKAQELIIKNDDGHFQLSYDLAGK